MYMYKDILLLALLMPQNYNYDYYEYSEDKDDCNDIKGKAKPVLRQNHIHLHH